MAKVIMKKAFATAHEQDPQATWKKVLQRCTSWAVRNLATKVKWLAFLPVISLTNVAYAITKTFVQQKNNKVQAKSENTDMTQCLNKQHLAPQANKTTDGMKVSF